MCAVFLLETPFFFSCEKINSLYYIIIIIETVFNNWIPFARTICNQVRSIEFVSNNAACCMSFAFQFLQNLNKKSNRMKCWFKRGISRLRLWIFVRLFVHPFVIISFLIVYSTCQMLICLLKIHYNRMENDCDYGFAEAKFITQIIY